MPEIESLLACHEAGWRSILGRYVIGCRSAAKRHAGEGIFDMHASDFRAASNLTEDQTRELRTLYQAEWWTRGRSVDDVRQMSIGSDHAFGLRADPGGQMAALARVAHLERYCLPEWVPFYEKWGFSIDVTEVTFMMRRAEPCSRGETS